MRAVRAPRRAMASPPSIVMATSARGASRRPSVIGAGLGRAERVRRAGRANHGYTMATSSPGCAPPVWSWSWSCADGDILARSPDALTPPVEFGDILRAFGLGSRRYGCEGVSLPRRVRPAQATASSYALMEKNLVNESPLKSSADLIRVRLTPASVSVCASLLAKVILSFLSP